ncbi:SPOR domain-containing protein [Apilactobacillus kunkeei]|uniref:Uncharacterized protein n=1 Tax=Apilactobacillus kunkeei TaxID=148814 RepID=A0A0P7LZZ5_9LACO|nr:hypothetical protein [Apilactobacillus kunkeei]KPN84136.1 hypothetical protein RZ78_04190 [Apilactobacillus kunkeei]
MKGSNISNLLKKALFMPVLLLSVSVSMQFANSVHVHADGVDETSTGNVDEYPINQTFYLNSSEHNDYNAEVHFNDITPSQGQYVSGANPHINDLVIKGYKNRPIDMRNAKIKLSDLGFDSSSIPDTYTPTGDSYTFNVEPIGFKQMEADKSTKFKYLFTAIDQNYNLVKSYTEYSNNDTESSSKSWPWIKNDGYLLNPLMYLDGDEIPEIEIPTSNDYDYDNGYGEGNIPQYSQDYEVTYANVVVPTHTLKINYIDQNNNIVFSTQRQVTSYGHTSFYSDESLLNKNGITINDGQTFIPNTDTTANINVTSSGKSGYDSFYDYGYPQPVYDLGVGHDNPLRTGYHTEVDLIGSDGQNILSEIAGSSQSQIVDSKNFFEAFFENQNRNNYTITGLPKLMDLTKGPYTAYTNLTYRDLFPGASDSGNSSQTNGNDTQQSTSQTTKGDTDSSQSTSTPSNSNQQQAQNNSQQTEPQTTKSDVNSSQPAQSNQQQSAAEPAKSSTQPAPTPAPVVQSHATAAPVTSTEKATPEPAQAPKQTQSPAPQPAVKTTSQSAKPVVKAKADSSKPTKVQLKAITKTYKKSEHVVKTDTSKLKALKKKMKKHATKKQKATYKKLQTKLAAEKKAFNSVKTREGKITKYFKSVSTINHESKQIKSLTAQIKKLKKKHSKTSKKLYKKDLKALKKANKTLKAATKFVKNYK